MVNVDAMKSENNESETDAAAESLGDESAYEDATDFKRRMRRGDETKGDPDDRDVAGDYSGGSNDADPARDQGLGRTDLPS